MTVIGPLGRPNLGSSRNRATDERVSVTMWSARRNIALSRTLSARSTIEPRATTPPSTRSSVQKPRMSNTSLPLQTYRAGRIIAALNRLRACITLILPRRATATATIAALVMSYTVDTSFGRL